MRYPLEHAIGRANEHFYRSAPAPDLRSAEAATCPGVLSEAVRGSAYDANKSVNLRRFRIWLAGLDFLCPRPGTHLTYTIDIALTAEFAIHGGGERH
jgi:hypothetical protein